MKIKLINFKSRFKQIADFMGLQGIMDYWDRNSYYIRSNMFTVIILIGFPDIS